MNAVAYQGKLVLGKYSLIWEDRLDKGPSLRNESIAVAGAFDSLQSRHVKDANGLIFLQLVEQLGACLLPVLFPIFFYNDGKGFISSWMRRIRIPESF